MTRGGLCSPVAASSLTLPLPRDRRESRPSCSVLLARPRVNLIGPVFGYDLLRLSRKGRLFLLRAAYLLALLVTLSFTYTAFEARVALARSFSMRIGGQVYFGTTRVDPAQAMAQAAALFGSSFLGYFLVVQFAF